MALAGALAGCGAPGRTITPAIAPQTVVSENETDALAVGALPERSIARGTSWLSPDAVRGPVLYVASGQDELLMMYSYPEGKLLGTTTENMNEPDGVCSDNKGDVWVVNNVASAGGNDINEFKHGKLSVLRALANPGQYGNSCSWDPTTNDLAVSNHETYSSAPGSVGIYKKAAGTAKLYSIAGMNIVFFCAYDGKGDLYADGLKNKNGGFVMAVMPKGKHSFQKVSLKGAHINFPGQIFPTPKTLLVGDQEFQLAPQVSGVYQAEVPGYKVTGKMEFEQSEDVAGFWLDGHTLIAPETNIQASYYKDAVIYYAYPGNGKPEKFIKSDKFENVYGLAVSE